ncbi:unnamed protein product [Lactuca virosa]|uniref:Uncharacterized protein n=1 Tax=Lactuca virosa TaxID=75947 RepID=A0AAU9N2L5_9ASTR|nr:unnamed protein product [Lactuca virosa]
MEPETKKRKLFRPPPRRATLSPAGKKDLAVSTSTIKPMANVAQTGVVIDLRIQQAKNHAIAQAQQDGTWWMIDQVPDGIGMILGVAQLTLYLYYHDKAKRRIKRALNGVGCMNKSASN